MFWSFSKVFETFIFFETLDSMVSISRGSAGLIDTSTVDSTIFGTGKFYKEKQIEKKENIHSDIDEMINSTLNENEDK